MVALLLFVLGYTLEDKTAEATPKDSLGQHGAEPADPHVFDQAPPSGEIPPDSSAIPSDARSSPTETAATAGPLDTAQVPGPTGDYFPDYPNSPPGLVNDRKAQEAAARQQRLDAANNAETTMLQPASSNGTGEGRASGPSTGVGHYLASGKTPALSPFEVKAGTIIPSVMISGVVSELPGQLIAQVGENVYDTVTGRHLLIPQGARLVGIYDNGISMGQRRVLIAWTRVIFPDGANLDLGNMPGMDQAGYSGFSDRVNSHTARVFGQAILLSLITAGAQLSQPLPRRNDNAASFSYPQIVASSVGLQLSQLGMETIRRGMNIAPTLEIRPGYRFNIMVTKDIILEPISTLR